MCGHYFRNGAGLEQLLWLTTGSQYWQRNRSLFSVLIVSWPWRSVSSWF